ncbi:hypothetical protein EBU99_03840 [bacterium]|nr:hypothetical protein [bacterium]
MNRTLFPHFFAFLLTGGLLAYPGSCLDLLLRDFAWSPALFGVAMMLQGGFSFIGSRFAGRRCGGESYRIWVARSLWFLGAGVVLYYFADWTTLPLLKALNAPEYVLIAARMAGICFLGFGIGTNGILNNTAALVSSHPSFGLNLLNMGFTAGAVLFPFTTSQYLRLPGLTDGTIAWRLPAVALVVTYALLSVYVLQSAHLSQPPPVHSDEHAGVQKSLPLPVLAASLVLFCYVGSEINLSNSLGLISEFMFGFSNGDARVASSIFWAGLLSARLYFCFRSPPAQSYPLVTLGLSSICLVLFGLLFARAFSDFRDALFMSRLIIFTLGACIGGMYSLALGSLTVFFDVSKSRHYANLTVLSGVAGAVLLPFTYGQLSNLIGLAHATWFIVVTLSGMFVGAALLHYGSRRSRSVASV